MPGGTHAPQFEALSADAALVTVGIGGNDVGLVGAATDCLELGLLAPTGTACRSNFAKPDGGDRLVDEIAASAPKIAATLQGIHARSPQARVLIVGYPAVAPVDGRGCYPLVPLSNDDMAYLDEMLRRTNAMIAEQAAANDAEFVDTYAESVGHDVCTLPPTRWFEGVVPTMPAFPVHPNALGEASMARSVLRVLGQPQPAATLGSLTRVARSVRVGRAARFTYTLSRAATRDVRAAALAGPRALFEPPRHGDGERRGRREHAQAHDEAARPPGRPVPPDRHARRRRRASRAVPHQTPLAQRRRVMASAARGPADHPGTGATMRAIVQDEYGPGAEQVLRLEQDVA